MSYVLLVLCCAGFAALHNVWLLVSLLIAMKLVVTLGMGLNTYVYRSAPAEELTPTVSAGVSINHISSVAMRSSPVSCCRSSGTRASFGAPPA